ncbi:hypothetical protein AL01_09460 [Bombella intestini]|uniref:Helix-turn-helix domain-containing protein n=1 Tax=Bombella intestini TaxID=1539051 RepID=A0A1S8GMQ5_9PROT|nr:helix-turn-helix domain-containing protein [Bombella intestini]OOL16768.1 hypothetical protein AL01_09460 [Bombella intestini]
MTASLPEHTVTYVDKYMISFYRLKALFSALAQFREINRNQEAVYRALISYRGREGCFPSHATLAAESGVSERTVRNALREARKRGWIDWTNERYGRRQSSNRYRFLISNDYINKVLSGIKRFKRKSAELSEFFRRQNLPGSPYYYIKKEAKRLWETVEGPSEKLTPWQRLYQENPEAALAQLQTS